MSTPMKKLLSSGAILLMVATSLVVMVGSTLADDSSRAIEVTLPEWDFGSEGTEWQYEYEDPAPEQYDYIQITISAQGCTVTQYNTPTDTHTDVTRKVLNSDGNTYSVRDTQKFYETGSWEWTITDWQSDCPGANGSAQGTGTYSMTTGDGTSTQNVKVTNLNMVSATWSRHIVWTFQGDSSYTYDYQLTDGVDSVTTGGADAEWKPNWDSQPMKEGDSWAENQVVNSAYSIAATVAGDVTGSGNQDWDIDWTYDYTWSVTDSGTHPALGYDWDNSLGLTRTGSWTATWTVSGNPGGPQTETPGDMINWIAQDSGHATSYNETTFLVGPDDSTVTYPYDPFENTLPEIIFPDGALATTPGSTSISIPMDDSEGSPFVASEDEAFTFAVGYDNDGVAPYLQEGTIIVVDPNFQDPDPEHLQSWKGTLSIASSEGRSVTSEGGPVSSAVANVLDFTPEQPDVGEYTATLRVWDDYTEEDLGVAPTDPNLFREAVFTLVVANTNDAPTVSATKPIPPTGIDLVEGETTEITTWTVDQVFEDIDLDFDAAEDLTFAMSPDPDITVEFVPGPLYSQHPHLKITPMDLKFPGVNNELTPRQLTLTATDEANAKSQPVPVLLNIRHKNHLPMVVEKGIEKAASDYNKGKSGDEVISCKDKGTKGECTIAEDVQVELDLRTVFKDADVPSAGDLSYVTTDKLGYAGPASDHIDVEVKSLHQAFIQGALNYNGADTVTFSAKDTHNEQADYPVTFTVSPINDLPEILGQKAQVNGRSNTETELEVDETDDGKEAGDFSEVELSVDVEDVDVGDTLTYSWKVLDGEKEEVDSQTGQTYHFVTAFKGGFDGGSDSVLYTVVLTVTDQTGASAPDVDWFITVKNVNRAPTIDAVEGTAGSDLLTLQPGAKTSLKFGKTVTFDAGNGTTDPDEGDNAGEGLDALTFDWTATKAGTPIDLNLYSDPNQPWIISFKAGKDLPSGIYEVTVVATDSEGASDSYTFTVDVGKDPSSGSGVPGFEGVVFVAAMAVALVAIGRRRELA